jgi:hypothetical protein
MAVGPLGRFGSNKTSTSYKAISPRDNTGDHKRQILHQQILSERSLSHQSANFMEGDFRFGQNTQRGFRLCL